MESEDCLCSQGSFPLRLISRSLQSPIFEYISLYIYIYVFLYLPLCLNCSRGGCFNCMAMLNATVQAHQLFFFRNVLSQSVLFPLGEGEFRLPWWCLKQHLASAPLSWRCDSWAYTWVVEAEKARLTLLSEGPGAMKLPSAASGGVSLLTVLGKDVGMVRFLG